MRSAAFVLLGLLELAMVEELPDKLVVADNELMVLSRLVLEKSCTELVDVVIRAVVTAVCDEV